MTTKGRYHKKIEKGRSRFYILLAVVLSVVLLRWGVPVLLDLIGNTIDKQDAQTGEEDIIPPQAPVVTQLPEATNSAQVAIKGITEGGANIELISGGVIIETATANDEGNFEFSFKLDPGDNSFVVKAVDNAGNESWSGTVSTTLDTKPPVLTITSPSDGAEVFGSNNTIEITGKVDDTEADLAINGSYVRINSDSTFGHRQNLNEGDNNLEIKLTDIAGNSVAKTIKVKYSR